MRNQGGRISFDGGCKKVGETAMADWGEGGDMGEDIAANKNLLGHARERDSKEYDVRWSQVEGDGKARKDAGSTPFSGSIEAEAEEG